jgi:FixJ family two-component response regulator
MKAGAVEFLTKPFRDQDLIDAMQHAIEKHKAAREERVKTNEYNILYDSLTPREREVFPLVTVGLLNKQIAAQLGASEKTIKVHRGQVMHKMRAESLAHLIRMAARLGLSSPKS